MRGGIKIMRSFSQRILFMMTVDTLLIIVAVYCAMLLRFDGEIPSEYLHSMIGLMPFIIVLNLGFLLAFRLYGRVWEYASWGELFSIVKAVTCSMIIFVVSIVTFRLPSLPRTVYILVWILVILCIAVSRLWW